MGQQYFRFIAHDAVADKDAAPLNAPADPAKRSPADQATRFVAALEQFNRAVHPEGGEELGLQEEKFKAGERTQCIGKKYRTCTQKPVLKPRSVAQTLARDYQGFDEKTLQIVDVGWFETSEVLRIDVTPQNMEKTIATLHQAADVARKARVTYAGDDDVQALVVQNARQVLDRGLPR